MRKYLSYIIIDVFSASHWCPMRLRRFILRLYGHQISSLFPDYFMGIGKGRLTIGFNSFCNYRCFFDLSEDINIGENCSIGFGVTFINSSHKIGCTTKRAGEGQNRPIVVEDGCWIGANVIILPGVKIAKGCIVGAGGCVTKSTLPNGLYVGVPAKRIKDLD